MNNYEFNKVVKVLYDKEKLLEYSVNRQLALRSRNTID